MANFTPLDSRALEEGYRAGRRGLTPADNPYPAVMCEAIAWLIGFADGRKKRLQVVGGSPSLKS
jgi:ribosome modulation factor